MRKFLLYFVAVFMLASCDNLKAKNSESDEKEKTSKKIKKPLDDEEDEDQEEDDTRSKKKKKAKDDEEYINDEDNSEDEDESNYRKSSSKGWSSAEKNTFMSTCVDGAKSSMGQSKATSYCNCMMDKIEEIYPDANDAEKMDQQKMMEMAQDCLR